jgi:hypothetical protein
LIYTFATFFYIYILISKKEIIKMGRYGAPFYGEDLGSAIETAEKVIAKLNS